MKIKGFTESNFDSLKFESQEEWDDECQKQWDRVNLDEFGRKLMVGWYDRHRYRSYPSRFPCTMIFDPNSTEGGDGPRIYENFFIYEIE